MGSTDDRSIAVQPLPDHAATGRAQLADATPGSASRELRFLDAGLELHRAVLEQRRSHCLCRVVVWDEITLVAKEFQEPVNRGGWEPLRHVAQEFSKVGSLGLDIAGKLEQSPSRLLAHRAHECSRSG
jgi:hypothetical protein